MCPVDDMYEPQDKHLCSRVTMFYVVGFSSYYATHLEGKIYESVLKGLPLCLAQTKTINNA